jgi:hypothetical protein
MHEKVLHGLRVDKINLQARNLISVTFSTFVFDFPTDRAGMRTEQQYLPPKESSAVWAVSCHPIVARRADRIAFPLQALNHTSALAFPIRETSQRGRAGQMQNQCSSESGLRRRAS